MILTGFLAHLFERKFCRMSTIVEKKERIASKLYHYHTENRGGKLNITSKSAVVYLKCNGFEKNISFSSGTCLKEEIF